MRAWGGGAYAILTRAENDPSHYPPGQPHGRRDKEPERTEGAADEVRPNIFQKVAGLGRNTEKVARGGSSQNGGRGSRVLGFNSESNHESPVKLVLFAG